MHKTLEMKFRDNKEHDPESYGYLVLYRKEVEAILNRRKENPEYKKSFELVRETINQNPTGYIYRVKLKDLDIGEGFHSEDINYISKRIE